MLRQHKTASVVTAILPKSTSRTVLDGVVADSGYAALTWQARGTLLKDNWLQRFLPPISPAKSIVQMLVPDNATEALMQRIVDAANLHKQATGAVFSQSCDNVFVGLDSPALHSLADARGERASSDASADLSLIVCIVDKIHSDRISRAAVSAGAHGPIIHLCEGRGLRDRLGWLRITKQHEKDVLLVMTGKSDVDQVFQAMASAGDLHLPGRGFMYRMDIAEGLYNLPSLISNRHYAANVQQIINAIDHLTGHTHWRDGALRNVGTGASAVGLDGSAASFPLLDDHACLSAIVPHDKASDFIDILLDAGIKGVNFAYARYANEDIEARLGAAMISDDYAVMNAVCRHSVLAEIQKAVGSERIAEGLNDVLLFTNPVRQIASYVYRPGQVENRAAQAA